jgi:PKD repeat protein
MVIDRDICVGDSIRITDSSDIAAGNIISWQYDFGDGSSLLRNTNTPFFHKYSPAGNYTLTLVTTSSPAAKAIRFRKTITVANTLSAAVSYAGNLCVGNSISFTSSYTNASGTNWYWNFGDGQIINTTAGNTVTHTYSTSLTNIVVSHTVSVGQGCASDTIFTILPRLNKAL